MALGNEALGDGRLQEAIEAFGRARAADPADPVAWLNHGFACLENGDATTALDDLLRCLALAPPTDHRVRADAHFLIGRARASQGQHPEAEAAYQGALASAPDFEEARDALCNVRVERALAMRVEGRCEEALALLDQVLADDAACVAALDERGAVLLELGRAAEAVVTFERAISVDGTNADRLANLSAASHQLAGGPRGAA